MRAVTTISSVSIFCLLAVASMPLSAQRTGEIVVETTHGQETYPGIEYRDKVYISLESVADLVSGGRTLEPGLDLRGRELRAIPAMDGSSKAIKIAWASLQLNPSLARAGRSAVISSNVVDIKGTNWVPLEDLVKATGAKANIAAFPDVCKVRVPNQCSRCTLVTAVK